LPLVFFISFFFKSNNLQMILFCLPLVFFISFF
jgi:hypothetical protein